MKIKHLGTENIVGDVFQAVFESDSKFSFSPGQFVEIVFPDLESDPRGRRREFTIASAPSELPNLSITYKKSDSPFKQRLLGLAEGEEVEVVGPYGDFILADRQGVRTYFIAGGVGITPALSTISHLASVANDKPISLIYIDSTGHHPHQTTLLEAQKKLSNLELFLETERLEESYLSERIKNLEQSHFYISGPPRMVVDAKRLLESLGARDEQIFTDEFVGYAE